MAVETAFVFGPETSVFLKELSGRLRLSSGEEKYHAYLLQRLSVAVQRGNAAAVLGTIKPPAYSDTFFLILMCFICVLIIIIIIIYAD